MTLIIITLLGTVLGLIIFGLPIAWSIGISSTVASIIRYKTLLSPFISDVMVTHFVAGIRSFPLLAMPLFILTGHLMNEGNSTKKLFGFVESLTGHWRGGFGHANVLASMLFAGMSGSATADAAGLGIIEIKAMTDAGYDKDFSAAITAASALIGPIIPPSLAMIAYGVVTKVSIGKLFLGGVIPGILMALTQMIMVSYYAKIRGYPKREGINYKEVWDNFKGSIFALLIPVIILGGIYSGVFTPTEAAAIAAFYSLLIGLLVYKGFSIKKLYKIFMRAMVESSVIMLIVGAISVFSQVAIRTRVPMVLANTLANFTENSVVLLLLFTLFFLITGCFISQTPAILVLAPILLPVAEQFNVDPIHFGLVMVLSLTIGMLTPPVGGVLFVIMKISNISLARLAILCLPFTIAMVLVVIILILFPPLVTLLPNLIYGF